MKETRLGNGLLSVAAVLAISVFAASAPLWAQVSRGDMRSYSEDQTANGVVIAANMHSFIRCPAGSVTPLINVSAEVGALRYWGYEYVGGEPPFTGKFFVSQAELTAHPDYARVNTLEEITGLKLYYFMLEKDMLFRCGTGFTLPTECGNSVKEASEQCDDGNKNNDDGCSNECKTEFCKDSDGKNSYVNGRMETHNGVSDDSCVVNDSTGSHIVKDCRGPDCGLMEFYCDATNTKPLREGIWCPEGCIEGRCAEPRCGNGFIETDEQCDDKNAMSGDGCSNECVTEIGYSCEGAPSFCQLVIPSMGDTSSSPNNCSPIVCSNGTQHPRCSENGSIINYFRDPCVEIPGQPSLPPSSSSSKAITTSSKSSASKAISSSTPSQTGCLDTDGGVKYNVRGRIEIAGEVIDIDKCDDIKMVNEKYCGENNEVKSKAYRCPANFICNSGYCSGPSTCSDSDGGENTAVKGTAAGLVAGFSQSYKDRCIVRVEEKGDVWNRSVDSCTSSDPGCAVTEAYCMAHAEDVKRPMTKQIGCPHGCKLGACLPAPVPAPVCGNGICEAGENTVFCTAVWPNGCKPCAQDCKTTTTNSCATVLCPIGKICSNGTCINSITPR